MNKYIRILLYALIFTVTWLAGDILYELIIRHEEYAFEMSKIVVPVLSGLVSGTIIEFKFRKKDK